MVIETFFCASAEAAQQHSAKMVVKILMTSKIAKSPVKGLLVSEWFGLRPFDQHNEYTNYSLLNELTGFCVAALIDSKLTVSKATPNAPNPA